MIISAYFCKSFLRCLLIFLLVHLARCPEKRGDSIVVLSEDQTSEQIPISVQAPVVGVQTQYQFEPPFSSDDHVDDNEDEDADEDDDDGGQLLKKKIDLKEFLRTGTNEQLIELAKDLFVKSAEMMRRFTPVRIGLMEFKSKGKTVSECESKTNHLPILSASKNNKGQNYGFVHIFIKGADERLVYKILEHPAIGNEIKSKWTGDGEEIRKLSIDLIGVMKKYYQSYLNTEKDLFTMKMIVEALLTNEWFKQNGEDNGVTEKWIIETLRSLLSDINLNERLIYNYTELIKKPTEDWLMNRDELLTTILSVVAFSEESN